MNSKLCKQIRKQSKTILVEWFKTLVSEDQSKGVDEGNIISYLSPQTHIFTSNQMHLSAYSYRWVIKKVKTLIKKTNMDVSSVGLQDIGN
jgi:hypothetical protein